MGGLTSGPPAQDPSIFLRDDLPSIPHNPTKNKVAALWTVAGDLLYSNS